MREVRRVVLVGLPGAGKSSVGPILAERLGWRFVDLDARIVAEAGRSIPEIFATEGESGFRARESAATVALAGEGRLVLAPGGGWVTRPENRAALGPGTLEVYLRVSPAVASARLGAAGGDRPLLAAPNPEKTLSQLLMARERLYLQANHTVSVDLLSPDEVAASIVALATRGEGD